MGPVDVRRLAAIDMHGAAGMRRRRTVITVEFLVGMVAGTAVGLFVMAGADGLGWRLFGAYLAAVGLNYTPLALHALTLLRRPALDRELAGVDIGAALRRYTKLQFWLAVPLLLVVISMPQALGMRPANA